MLSSRGICRKLSNVRAMQDEENLLGVFISLTLELFVLYLYRKKDGGGKRKVILEKHSFALCTECEASVSNTTSLLSLPFVVSGS